MSRAQEMAKAGDLLTVGLRETIQRKHEQIVQLKIEIQQVERLITGLAETILDNLQQKEK